MQKNLPENPEALKQLCQSLYAKIDWLERDVGHLEAQLRLAAYSRFGAKSEQSSHPGMQNLFAEAAAVDAQDKPEEKKVAVKGHERAVTRKPLPENLPREEILVDVADKRCACCGSEDLKKVSEQISEKLHYKPAEVVVHKYIRPIYSCRSCETMSFELMPAHPIPKCSVTTDTIAQICVSKYVDALPLYRQELIFKRSGVEIGRDKMARWLIQMSEKLEPIVDLLRTRLLAGEIVQMDETSVQVLKEQGRVPTAKSYMIVQARGSPGADSIVLFSYNPSRACAVLEDLLIGYSGILLSDGLEVYATLCAERTDIVHAGCWSHARRKVVEAQKALKPSRRKESLAGQALELIDRLFKIEREAKELSPAEVLVEREKKSKSLIEELSLLVEKNLADFPKASPTGKALHYMVNQFGKLTKFLDDGRIPVHNNFTENMIRPFTIGRKNWLFSDTPEGAKASAIIYSLVVTAQVNGINPLEYLCRALKGVAVKSPAYEMLLPLKDSATVGVQ